MRTGRRVADLPVHRGCWVADGHPWTRKPITARTGSPSRSRQLTAAPARTRGASLVGLRVGWDPADPLLQLTVDSYPERVAGIDISKADVKAVYECRARTVRVGSSRSGRPVCRPTSARVSHPREQQKDRRPFSDPSNAPAGWDADRVCVGVALRFEHGRSGTMVLIHLVMVSARAVVSGLVCGQSGPLLSTETSCGAARLGVVKYGAPESYRQALVSAAR